MRTLICLGAAIAAMLATPAGASCRPRKPYSSDPVKNLMVDNDIVLRARAYTVHNPIIGDHTLLVPIRIYKGPKRPEYLMISYEPTLVMTPVIARIREVDGTEVTLGLYENRGGLYMSECSRLYTH